MTNHPVEAASDDLRSSTGKPLPMTQLIERALLSSPLPLTGAELQRLLPPERAYSTASFLSALRKAPFALRIQGTRFLHLSHGGLRPAQRQRLVAMTLTHLPADGTPLAARTLLELLRRGATALLALPCATETLWLLAAHHARLQVVPWSLIARRPPLTEGGAALGQRSLVERAVLAVIADLKQGTIGQIHRALRPRYDILAAERSLAAVVARCARQGLLCALPKGRFSLPQNPTPSRARLPWRSPWRDEASAAAP